MSRLIVPVLCAGSVLLAGCRTAVDKQDASTNQRHGSPLAASASTSPGTTNPLHAAAEPVVVCFGDSLTAGLNIDPGETYPDDLQRLLDARGFHYRVVNAGISGETTKDGLMRIGRVLARHPALVVVEFGGNDGLRGLPVSETQRNLSTIVRTLQAGGTQVALAGITLPPQFGSDYIHQFNAMFPAVAAETHVPLLPFLLQDVYGVDGDIQDDGIHPTARGAKQVAINIQKLISPLLRK